MNFQCQEQAILNLRQIVEADRHTVVIAGCKGCGKTYLVKEWASMLGISDVAIVNPSVNELKSVIDTIVDNRTPTVLCVENLDEGVIQAAYPLLKFLEECPNYIYAAVTCTNVRDIPETILSRCFVIDVAMPTASDLELYAASNHSAEYHSIKDKPIWNCVKSFTDAKTILELDSNKLAFFESLSTMLEFKGNVSSIAWNLQHYSDNSETPVILIIRYLMQLLPATQLKPCLDCLNDLENSRISKNAILCKLIFELKYTE